MKNILTNSKNFIGKTSINKNLYVFLACVFLSTFYWLINVLDNQYTSDVKVNIEYINQPSKYVILNELPSQLNLSITSIGYDLLWYQLNFKKYKVVIDLSNYQIDGEKSKHKVYFKDFINTFSTQIGSKIFINEISPKFVLVELDDKIFKKLDILPTVKLNFNNEYQLADNLLITPSKVEVIGPKSILDSLNFIPTNLLEVNNIEGSLIKDIELDDDFIKKNHLQVKKLIAKLTIHTDKFTEVKLNLPITIINLSDSVDMDIIPRLIEVKFLVPLSKLSILKQDNFKIEVDCNELSQGYKKLKVHLSEHPDFIKNITLKPAKVEYVLKRKAI